MKTPDTENNPRPKMPSAHKVDSGYNLGFTRKILIGTFILGFWVYFYWFQGS